MHTANQNDTMKSSCVSQADSASNVSDFRISPREIEILNLVSYGRSTIDIAGILSISRETVKSHRRHLMQKLGATNCALMVRKGYETGLLQ